MRELRRGSGNYLVRAVVISQVKSCRESDFPDPFKRAKLHRHLGQCSLGPDRIALRQLELSQIKMSPGFFYRAAFDVPGESLFPVVIAAHLKESSPALVCYLDAARVEFICLAQTRERILPALLAFVDPRCEGNCVGIMRQSATSDNQLVT